MIDKANDESDLSNPIWQIQAGELFLIDEPLPTSD
jgi:hypothetical protein